MFVLTLSATIYNNSHLLNKIKKSHLNAMINELRMTNGNALARAFLTKINAPRNYGYSKHGPRHEAMPLPENPIRQSIAQTF